MTKNNNLPPRIQGLENVHWLPFDGTLTRRDGTVYNAYEVRHVKEYYWFGTDGLGRDILPVFGKEHKYHFHCLYGSIS